MSTTTKPFWVSTDDWHTAGEPFRIVSEVPFPAPGSSVAERRRNIMAEPNHPLDLLRRALCHEPRGHADMYGGFITPPDDPGASFGVLFWHKDGFSTACGHGTIALGCWALEKGLVQQPEGGNGDVEVVIDVPSGRVMAKLHIENRQAKHVDFINVLSYQLDTGIPVKLASGTIEVDLTFAGAVYATVDAAKFEVPIVPASHDQFIKLGREIKAALGTRGHYQSYDLYGTIFFEKLEHSFGPKFVRQRNVTVFADGQIDRSPCGSGTAGRVAVLLAQGAMDKDSTLIHESIVDTTFEGVISSVEPSPSKYPACISRVRGLAYLCGTNRFYINPSDPVYPGFVFR
jgi:trans-L-3-hydroxyproline dehydratase